MAPLIMVLFMVSSFLTFAQGREDFSKHEVVKILREAYEAQRKITPTKDAELYYQYETNDKPCVHCPEYLNLVREVNKIVEKLPSSPGESVAVQNESLIQLNRLKFIYYEVKIAEENGAERCVQYQHADPLNRNLIRPDDTILMAEEALSLPNVTSMQYVPKGNEKAIHYFYRGVGKQQDILVEVVIYPDRKAVLRYHKFQGFNTDHVLPDLGSSHASNKKNTPPPFPTDVDFIDEKSTVSLPGGLNISSDSKAKIHKQSVGVAFNDDSGKDWLKVDVSHQTLKNVEVTTVVPLEWNINDGSLKLGGAVKYQGTANYKDKTTDQKKTLVLGLTDHNHEYLKTTVISRDDAEQVILSSRFNMGEYGSVSSMASTDSRGRKEYNVSHGIKDNTSSTTTKIGVGADARKYIELQREQNIDKNQSMILTIRTNDRQETTIMYQYKIGLR